MAAGEEVVAVTFIEPDFVVPPKVRERFNDRAVLFVDDHGIECPGGDVRCSLAGSDCSAPSPFLAAQHNRRGDNKGVHDLLSVGRSPLRHLTIRMPGDTGDTDIEHAGAGAIPALFSAIIGLRCPIRAIKW